MLYYRLTQFGHGLSEQGLIIVTQANSKLHHCHTGNLKLHHLLLNFWHAIVAGMFSAIVAGVHILQYHNLEKSTNFKIYGQPNNLSIS